MKEIEVNYIAPLRIVQSFSKNLKGKTNKAIVNIASIASFVNFPAGRGDLFCLESCRTFSDASSAT